MQAFKIQELLDILIKFKIKSLLEMITNPLTTLRTLMHWYKYDTAIAFNLIFLGQ